MCKITIDPGVQYGRPCIAGTGIPAECVFDRFRAGESILALGTDYGQGRDAIEAAIRYCCKEELDLLRKAHGKIKGSIVKVGLSQRKGNRTTEWRNAGFIGAQIILENTFPELVEEGPDAG